MDELNFPRGIPVMVPRWLFLTTGFGTDKEHKNARDHASAPAGLADLTLIAGTSALPPGIEFIGRDEFNSKISPGRDIIAIHGYCESNVPGQLVNSTLSIAYPADGQGRGYVAELYEWPGIHPEIAIRRTERMVMQLYANRHGVVDFDPFEVWEPGKDTYTLAGRDVKLFTIQAAGIVPESGDWACALVAAVLG
jgi:arginine decarboxylase